MRIKLIGVSKVPRKCECVANGAEPILFAPIEESPIFPAPGAKSVTKTTSILLIVATSRWPKSVTKHLMGGYCKRARTMI